MKKTRADVSEIQRFERYHPLYEAYVNAENIYLSEPTAEHWQHKEEAFDKFTRALSGG